MKLYLLSGGILDVDRSVIHPGDDSCRRVIVPVMQVLIQSEDRAILVDTGCPPCAVDDNQALERVYGIETSLIRPIISIQERIDTQLALLGLRPSDLDMVVNTHFHFDHAGGNALFTGLPIAAQEAELVAVHESDDYVPVWDAPGIQFQTARGDWSPLPGVEMLLTPGHTPGHQSMLVRLTEQSWLFTWDAVYTEEHWREGKLGAVTDVAAARASVERLHAVATAENARTLFGHDIGQWETLKHAPEYYT